MRITIEKKCAEENQTSWSQGLCADTSSYTMCRSVPGRTVSVEVSSSQRWRIASSELRSARWCKRMAPAGSRLQVYRHSNCQFCCGMAKESSGRSTKEPALPRYNPSISLSERPVTLFTSSRSIPFTSRLRAMFIEDRCYRGVCKNINL